MAGKILYRQDKPLLQASEKEAEADAVRSAAQLKKDVDKALEGLRKSKTSEMYKHVGALQKARDAGSVAKILDVLYSKADYKTRQLLANAVSFDFLARWTEKTLPPVKDAYDVVQKLVGHTAQVQESGLAQIQMLDQDFKADPTLEAKLNELLPLVTIVQVDPSNRNAIEREPRLDQMYAALGEDGQRVYKRIIGFHENLREYQEFLLDKNIKDLPGLSDEVKQNLLNQIYQKFQAERRIEPYLPLVRDPGEFWLAVGRDENTQIYTYETREEREADLERIRREDYNNAPLEDLMGSREVAVGNELKELRGQVDISGSLLPKLFDAIDKNVPPNQQDAASVKETNEQLKNDIFDIWLTMLPEQAFRRQFAQRKARAGYRPDIRRNLASHVSRVAPLLSRLKFGNDLRSQETRLRELVRYSEHLTPFKQSVEERIRGIMSPRGYGFWDSMAGAANKLTYLTYLTGASTALLQPFGLLISGIPILTANHKANPAAVVKELLKNATYFKQYGVIKKLPDGRTEYVAPSLTNNRNLPEDERRAIAAMAASNVVNQTYTGFLWDVAKGEDLNVTRSKGAKLADFLLNALLRNTERLTREALYLASYRLGRGRGLSEAEAIEQAIADTKESLGDYDISGRPTWMQGPAGRVLFSMKMYPVIMIQQLFGSMYKMLPALNKEGKAQALTKFSGLMMTTAMLAGMYNMPFADVIISMLTQFLGEAEDEDMPDELKDIDPVLWFKTVWMPNKLGSFDILGVPLDEIIGEGAISAATGMNIGQRIGLNDLWARDGKPSASTPEAVGAFLESYFGGPLWSYGKSIAKAVDDFAIGDYQRAVERVVPLAPARNLLTAQRAATEGYETPRGTIVEPEDVSAADLVWQSMGFTPSDVAAARSTSFKLTGAQQKILNQRQLLMRRIKFADKKDDLDKLEQLYEEDLPRFNTKYPENRITPAQIRAVLEEQRKQQATSRAGVTVDKKNLRLVDEAVGNMEDRLERRQQ